VTGLETQHELFGYELDAAVAMEENVQRLLESFREKASSTRLRQQLDERRHETNQQIQNLYRALESLGHDPQPRPSPVIVALSTRAQHMISHAGADLIDLVILDCLIQLEHHEIAAYNALIITAETTGAEDLVPLFLENLEEEEQALEEAVKTAEQVSHLLAVQGL
jgi:ferritin-like metal-binding protein YciE